jgi:hypothetical protein
MAFPELPGDMYAYENQFNYRVWGAGTRLTLCNVPWDSSYNKLVRFLTPSEREDFDGTEAYPTPTREDYFASLPGKALLLDGVTYCRQGEPIRINLPFDVCNRYNYVVVDNPRQPVPGSGQPDRFFYFVNECSYIAPNTTQLNIQLDVFQSYYEQLEFRRSYVERGHVGLADIEADKWENRSEFLMEPEGFNLGEEYEQTNLKWMNLLDATPYVMVMCSADLTGGWGTVDKPILKMAKGGVYSGIPGASDCYILSGQNFTTLCEQLAEAPWVGQCISLITIIPRKLCEIGEVVSLNGITANVLKGVNNSTGIIVDNYYNGFHFPNRYNNLRKLFTYPYSFLELSAFNGRNVVLRPELIDPRSGQEGDFTLQIESNITPPNIRVAVYLPNYNRSKSDPSPADRYTYNTVLGEVVERYEPVGDYLDKAIIIDNFPQLSLLTNNYLNYLASTQGSRAYSEQSADWSQSRALMGSELSAAQSSRGIEAMQAQQSIANWSTNAGATIAQEQNQWNMVKGVVGGVGAAIGGAAAGAVAGPAGLVGGVAAGAGMIAGSVMDSSLNSGWIAQQAANSVTANNRSSAESQRLAMYNRDTNLSFAQKAASGDYANTIAGIQAKVQDAKVIAPGSVGLAGGETYNFANGLMGVAIRWKTVHRHYLVQICEYWLRYGYAINRFMLPPNTLRCMAHFTYWKMAECGIGGSAIPEAFKQTIRGIFERGTTVFVNPDKIDDYDATTYNNTISRNYLEVIDYA